VPPPEKDKDKKDEPKKDEPKKDAPRPPAPKKVPLVPEPGETEYERLMRLGRELFADGQYGRAANRFREAGRLEPKQAAPKFLLAQTLLQQGNYHGARDAILAGLNVDPAWPTRRFRPQELYGPDVEEYPELLRTLERVHARLPDDPTLLLLRGYVLWFDGRREQAAVLLRRARGGPDRAAVERFLAALPDEAPL
jgi:tetratricopeptide (TPR) repeat protein